MNEHIVSDLVIGPNLSRTARVLFHTYQLAVGRLWSLRTRMQTV